MAAQAQETKIYDISSEPILEELRSARYCSELNIDMKSENPSPTGVWFRYHHGTSFFSWAEKITVTVTPLSENKTQVNIHSECGMPTQVVDYGKNRRNVNALFRLLEKNLNMAGETDKAPVRDTQEAPVENVVVVEPTEEKIFCISCGAELAKTAIFCTACGVKQESKKIENICPNCQSVEKDEAIFCSQCGTKLK